MKQKQNGRLKKPTICIIGPGIVGQATGKVFIKHDYKTAFLGGNEEKTKMLKAGGYLAFRRDELFDGFYNFDISFLTVPTPTLNGKINLDYLKSATIDLAKRLSVVEKKYHLVVVKSTVPPGTTENLVIPLLEQYSGWKVGEDFGVCMNPEYLREKTSYEDSLNPRVILIGELDKKSGDLLSLVYSKFSCPIVRSTLKEAEMQKYVHNLYNAAKISFFNEMRMIGQQMGINTEKIFQLTALSAEGIWNPQYGIKDYGPFSGSCLPKDTKAFSKWAERNGFKTQLLDAVIKVNNDLLGDDKIAANHLMIGAQL